MKDKHFVGVYSIQLCIWFLAPHCVEYEGTELLKNSDADITDIQYLESSNKTKQ